MGKVSFLVIQDKQGNLGKSSAAYIKLTIPFLSVCS